MKEMATGRFRVLIVMDDVGYGDYGAYGVPDIRTPSVDRLARDGVKFTDFYAACPVCSPTRARPSFMLTRGA